MVNRNVPLSLSTRVRECKAKSQYLALIVISHDFHFTIAIFFILGSLMNIDQIHPENNNKIVTQFGKIQITVIVERMFS